ncbi:Gfo/Idh/MocA family protein [Bosea sp. NPDC003192]|uniref:Gfo/Idh/MocA family protein n=1 Tax=Bosea sp. NPDC003192 TaxID=3390551 RepID=UPI003CFEC9E6
MSAMRIGLAGFGAWGRQHARVYERLQGAELAAIFCRGEAAAQAATSSHPEAQLVRSFGELLALPLDVVAIAVPNHLHAHYAVEALKAGKHVILEKPLGTTLAECDAVLEAAQASGRNVAVNHELRVSQQWRQVREIIAGGEIGRVTHQHLSLFRRPFRPGSGGWRQDEARVGSYSLEELVHFVDLMMWYARENGLPYRVTARASDGSAMPQTLSALLDWQDGSSALVTQCLAGFQHHSLLEIAGGTGAIRTSWSGAFDRAEHPSFSLWVRADGESDAGERAIAFSGELFELEQNLASALASFAGQGEPSLSLVEARNAVALCLAIQEAGRHGDSVSLTDYWAEPGPVRR